MSRTPLLSAIVYSSCLLTCTTNHYRRLARGKSHLTFTNSNAGPNKISNYLGQIIGYSRALPNEIRAPAVAPPRPPMHAMFDRELLVRISWYLRASLVPL